MTRVKAPTVPLILAGAIVFGLGGVAGALATQATDQATIHRISHAQQQCSDKADLTLIALNWYATGNSKRATQVLEEVHNYDC